MVDLKSIQKEYVTTLKNVSSLEEELRKKREQSSALYSVIKAYGGEPGKLRPDTEHEDDDRLPLHLPPGTPIATLSEAIREAIPTSGNQFGIEDILPIVSRRFPAVKRGDIAGTLWRFSRQGKLKKINKGTRGTPVQYVCV